MYLLVTPARNEANNLPELIKAVSNQSMPPSLWVIVDHCSTDNSAAIIAKASEERGWIKLARAEAIEGCEHLSYSIPVRIGFEAALDYAARYGIAYNYVGILDADIVPEGAYFEKLINYLEISPKVGILSGQLFVIENGSKKPEDLGNLPRGGARLYRKDCFESIGGAFPKSPSPDTVTDIMAELKGWQISRFFSAEAIHKRKTNVRKGLWHGYWMRGRGHYYLNYHPLSAILTGLYFTTRTPFYQGIAYILGYCISLLKRDERTQDPLIRDYFWRSFARFARR